MSKQLLASVSSLNALSSCSNRVLGALQGLFCSGLPAFWQWALQAGNRKPDQNRIATYWQRVQDGEGLVCPELGELGCRGQVADELCGVSGSWSERVQIVFGTIWKGFWRVGNVFRRCSRRAAHSSTTWRKTTPNSRSPTQPPQATPPWWRSTQLEVSWCQFVPNLFLTSSYSPLLRRDEEA